MEDTIKQVTTTLQPRYREQTPHLNSVLITVMEVAGHDLRTLTVIEEVEEADMTLIITEAVVVDLVTETAQADSIRDLPLVLITADVVGLTAGRRHQDLMDHPLHGLIKALRRPDSIRVRHHPDLTMARHLLDLIKDLRQGLTKDRLLMEDLTEDIHRHSINKEGMLSSFELECVKTKFVFIIVKSMCFVFSIHEALTFLILLRK